MRRCEQIYGATFEDVYARFADAGLVSLRRAQFNLAKKKAAMAIFHDYFAIIEPVCWANSEVVAIISFGVYSATP